LFQPEAVSVTARQNAMPRSYHLLHFQPDAVHALCEELAGRSGRVVRVRTPEAHGDLELRVISRKLVGAVIEHDDVLVESLTVEFFRHLLGPYLELANAPREATGPLWVIRAIEFIRPRMTQKLTLGEIAEAAGRPSRFHFLREFRRFVGLTPHEYLLALRVSRARRLLAAGASCAEAAQAVGFYDQSLLNRHFRRLLGMTPGTWLRARRRVRATAVPDRAISSKPVGQATSIS
jgi:AraC-like DNA-binding protein